MKKNKSQSFFTAIGSSSLLVVFLVLCLTTFAILSLSSAKSDYSFTKRLAEHKSAYYKASSQAEHTASDIDSLLENTYRSKPMTQEEYLAALNPVLSSYGTVTLSYHTQDHTPVISYQIPVDGKQLLSVELRVTDPVKSPNYYEVQTWQICSSEEWKSDDTLNLIPIH